MTAVGRTRGCRSRRGALHGVGVLNLTAGQTSKVTAAVQGGLTSASHVLAIMQTHLASGTPGVLAAVPNVSPANTITIYLTAAVPTGQNVNVAWFVFG